MIYDLQKASIWKRVSAFLFDVILWGVLAVGVALLLSSIFGYDVHTARLDEIYQSYEGEHGVSFSVTAEEYADYTDAQIAQLDKAMKALAADEELIHVSGILLNLTLLITTFSILLAFVVWELIIPLILGNGQTLGKKIFGVAVMRVDGVKLAPLLLFVRTVLGKFTLETMIPVFLIIMLYFNLTGIVGIGAIVVLLLAQVILVIASHTNALLHDKLASTVVVDFASQMIFDTPEDLIEYKKRLHEAEAAKRD